jgi:predicted nucleotidyltransferase
MDDLNLVVKILFGSHLYGTNTPESDTDYKSVYVPPFRDILLQRIKDSVTIGGKTKREGEKNLSTDTDNECYSLQRYLGLIAEGQTVAVDMLFAPEPLLTTDLWATIRENKDRLLTKKSAAFVGYCRTQANKYGIKGSRVAAARNALERFEKFQNEQGSTAKVGEFLVAVEQNLDDHTRIVQKETVQGKVEWFFECCNRMVGFNNSVKEAANIFRRIHENYGDRARQAELNEGVDWKALSHAVRVGNEALELLETHRITFPLANASHILEIKKGLLPYQAVAEEIENLLVAVEKASETSTLRDQPDKVFIDDLVEETYRKEILRG